MEKKTKNGGGGKTEHGHPITADSRKIGKKGKKHNNLPNAKDDGDPGGKTEHGARGPKPL